MGYITGLAKSPEQCGVDATDLVESAVQIVLSIDFSCSLQPQKAPSLNALSTIALFCVTFQPASLFGQPSSISVPLMFTVDVGPSVGSTGT